MDDPKELVDLWHDYYKTKPTQSFSEYVSLQLKIGEKEAIILKFPDFSSWTTLEKNLAILNDVDSSLIDLLKNSNFLSKNNKLQNALNTLLNTDMIGNTRMLHNARYKVIKEFNRVMGENLQNVDELLEVLQNVKNPASYGSINEWYVRTKNLFKAGKTNPGKFLNIEGLGLKNSTRFRTDAFLESADGFRFGEIKAGYISGNIDLDQFDTYVSIFLNRFDESYKTIFKQLDIKPDEFKGVEYLFVPGKKGESALVAAREAYKKVIGKDKSRIMLFEKNNFVFKYLDFDNEVKTFMP